MATPQKYFNDRVVILLLIFNSLLAAIGSLLILFRLDASKNSGYIVEYRANSGFGDYTYGSVLQIASFIIFFVSSFAIAMFVSRRVYPIRRHIAISILGLNVILGLVAIVVSNALLVLR